MGNNMNYTPHEKQGLPHREDLSGIPCCVGGCESTDARLPEGGINGIDMEFCPYHMEHFG